MICWHKLLIHDRIKMWYNSFYMIYLSSGWNEFMIQNKRKKNGQILAATSNQNTEISIFMWGFNNIFLRCFVYSKIFLKFWSNYCRTIHSILEYIMKDLVLPCIFIMPQFTLYLYSKFAPQRKYIYTRDIKLKSCVVYHQKPNVHI